MSGGAKTVASRSGIDTLAKVEAMPDDEILAGYRSGLDGDDEPGGNHSDAFWHGWRNGASDRGRREIDADQRQIAREFVARGQSWASK
jgi:hypothetical protein